MTVSIDDITKSDKKETFLDSKIDSFSWKGYGLFVVLYLIVNSDVFIDNILSCYGPTLNGRELTLTGALISIIIIIIAHIFLTYQLDLT